MSSRPDVELVDQASDGGFVFRMPPAPDTLDQDEEWVSVYDGHRWRTLRIHDYDTLFKVPGLYEALVYGQLQCRSPARVVELLRQTLNKWSTPFEALRVLDLGAGNGIVGERLREAGVARIIGLDILPEAAAAAERDRAGVYDDYVVADLCDPDPATLERMRRQRPNALVTVAALGFSDIPPRAFWTAFNAIEQPGWVALTIKESFLGADDETGFRKLLRDMVAHGSIREEARLRIRHRLSIAGEPLFYTGLVCRKLQDIPRELLA